MPLWKVSLIPVHRLLRSSMVMRLSLDISHAAPGNPAYQMTGVSNVLRTLLTFILASAAVTCPLIESTFLSAPQTMMLKWYLTVTSESLWTAVRYFSNSSALSLFSASLLDMLTIFLRLDSISARVSSLGKVSMYELTICSHWSRGPTAAPADVCSCECWELNLSALTVWFMYPGRSLASL